MQNEINKALEVLKNGGTILYPTDTISGIGCDARNASAVRKIFDIKNEKSCLDAFRFNNFSGLLNFVFIFLISVL